MSSCLWDGAYKRTLAVNLKQWPSGGSRFPFSLSEGSFTICMIPYNCKCIECVIKRNKFLPSNLKQLRPGLGLDLRLVLGSGLGLGLELRKRLGNEWFLGLGYGYIYQWRIRCRNLSKLMYTNLTLCKERVFKLKKVLTYILRKCGSVHIFLAA